jgi:AmmeMemoRadiSam system protein B
MTLDLPKLRPLRARRVAHEGRDFVALEDPAGVVEGSVLVPLEGFHGIVRHFDGRTSLGEIRARLRRETGQDVGEEALRSMVQQLDQALVLDGPAFADFRDRYRREATRPAAFAGRSYAGDPPALRSQIDDYFRHGQGAGPLRALPSPGRPDGSRLRAVLCPHIDYFRGGPTYTWAYKELVERSDADVFVVLGVAHQYSRHRFAFTAKDFSTPLGLVKTDRAHVERLAEAAGAHLFDDELAHRTEHSIEFQAVFLQHLLGGRRDFAIVPVLVGSFHDLMDRGVEPIDDPEVRRFVEALKSAEAAGGRKVAYIGSIDLCHVGPEFGDAERLDRSTLEEVRRFDRELLDRAVAADPAGWFATAARVANRYRVCGLAATYTLLHAIGPARGRLLRYEQAVNPERTCGVTFASLALDAREDRDA